MIDSVSFILNFHKFSNLSHIAFPSGFHVIYGESGCGKSQFIRSLSGYKTHSESNFLFSDISIPESIQIVFQNPENQILAHTLESELAFAPECLSLIPNVLQNKLENLKSQLPFIHNWDRHPASLSGGEMEMLNLVTAFSTDPKLVMIDDGLSFLDQESKVEWVAWIRKQIGDEKTILWFTSDPADLDFGDTKLILSLSGLNKIDDEQYFPDYTYHHPKGKLNLSIKDLTFGYDDNPQLVIENWSGQINGARSIGLIGKNGKGKTTLSNLMTGIIQPNHGRIIMELNGKKPKVAALDQFPERMLGAESLGSLLSELIANNKMNIHLVNKCVNRLNSYQINWEIVKDQSALDIPWSTLRMALIIILAHCEYEVLILDEPTFGLGWEQKLILSRFFQEIMVNKHLVLISHDKQFIRTHCDHVYNLDNQSITEYQHVLIHDN